MSKLCLAPLWWRANISGGGAANRRLESVSSGANNLWNIIRDGIWIIETSWANTLPGSQIKQDDERYARHFYLQLEDAMHLTQPGGVAWRQGIFHSIALKSRDLTFMKAMKRHSQCAKLRRGTLSSTVTRKLLCQNVEVRLIKRLGCASLAAIPNERAIPKHTLPRNVRTYAKLRHP